MEAANVKSSVSYISRKAARAARRASEPVSRSSARKSRRRGIPYNLKFTYSLMSSPKEVPRPLEPGAKPAPKDDRVVCERCGGEMYRMHAVWRCAACGFKTDCCGW